MVPELALENASPFIRLIVKDANCRHGLLADGLGVQVRMGASKPHPRTERFPFPVLVRGYFVFPGAVNLGGDCISLIDCLYTPILVRVGGVEEIFGSFRSVFVNRVLDKLVISKNWKC